MRLTIAAALATTWAPCLAAQDIVATPDSRSWGENIGWVSWGVGEQPAQYKGSHLRGFVYGENIGWVALGAAGGPKDGVSYTNASSDDFGVNVEPQTGVMSGMAWAENAGWINFATTPALGEDGARFDARASRLRGYAWGENIGWINFDADEAGKIVEFEPISPPADLDGDGFVTSSDLNILLGGFGVNVDGDIDGDGDTDSADLNLLLAAFGT